MRLNASKSMLIATLALSSSSPCLAAPLADVTASGLVSSSSNQHLSSRRGSVSYDQQEARTVLVRAALSDELDEDEQRHPSSRRSSLSFPPINREEKRDMVSDLVGTVFKTLCPVLGGVPVVNGILCPSPVTGTDSVASAEDLAVLQAFVDAAGEPSSTEPYESVSSSDPSMTTTTLPSSTPAPPNTPNPSSESTETPERRDPVHRRGIAARTVEAPAPAAPVVNVVGGGASVVGGTASSAIGGAGSVVGGARPGSAVPAQAAPVKEVVGGTVVPAAGGVVNTGAGTVVGGASTVGNTVEPVDPVAGAAGKIVGAIGGAAQGFKPRRWSSRGLPVPVPAQAGAVTGALPVNKVADALPAGTVLGAAGTVAGTVPVGTVVGAVPVGTVAGTVPVGTVAGALPVDTVAGAAGAATGALPTPASGVAGSAAGAIKGEASGKREEEEDCEEV